MIKFKCKDCFNPGDCDNKYSGLTFPKNHTPIVSLIISPRFINEDLISNSRSLQAKVNNTKLYLFRQLMNSLQEMHSFQKILAK